MQAYDRYVMVFFCFIATVICYLDRVSMSVAAISLQNELGWSETKKGFVLSAFFIGYMLVQIPAGILANRYGGRVVLGLAVMLWSAFTFLTPFFVSISFGALVILRIALGMGEAAAFPAIFSLYKSRIPDSERARAVAFTLSGGQAGTLLALLATGPIISFYDWRAVFYIYGTLGLMWFVPWIIWSGREKIFSGDDRTQVNANVIRRNIPWKHLIFNKRLIALMASHFCVNWSIYTLIAWLPTYFYRTQSVDIAKSSIYAAMPYMGAIVVGLTGGILADRIVRGGVPVATVRKIFQSFGLFGSATFLILSLVNPIGSSSMMLMIGAVSMLSLTFSGTSAAILEIDPEYSDIISGFVNTFGTLPGILGVFVTGFLIDYTGDIRTPFFLCGIVSVIGGAIWLRFGGINQR